MRTLLSTAYSTEYESIGYYTLNEQRDNSALLVLARAVSLRSISVKDPVLAYSDEYEDCFYYTA